MRRNRIRFWIGVCLMGAMFAGFASGAILDSTTVWRISATVGLVGTMSALIALWEEMHPGDGE